MGILLCYLEIDFKMYLYVPEIGYRMRSSQGAVCTVALCDVALMELDSHIGCNSVPQRPHTVCI